MDEQQTDGQQTHRQPDGRLESIMPPMPIVGRSINITKHYISHICPED